MADPRPVRIFISSPDDVRPERGIAARVVHRLAREFAHHFTVEAVLWEREPLLASAHFQDGLIAPHDTDIVVVVLWSRLGLPLPADKYTGPLSGRRVTGTEWEFEDALAGYRQRQRPELLVYRKHAEVVARIGDRAAVEEQQRQAELVEDFMRRWFSDADGVSATAAWRAFADGAAFEGMLEQHLRELLRRRLAGSAGKEGAIVRWHQGSPYRGLEAFEPEHEQIFFGRTRARNEVRELLARQVANGTAFVLVMGASGSGKSSLVKAAVVPELSEAGMVGHAAMVRHALTRPGAFDAAGGPLSGLAAALFEGAALPELAAASSDNTPDALAALLARTPTAAAEPIRHALAAVARTAGVTSRGEARLLLVVDQLEELFTTDGISPEDRTRYVAALAALASSGLVWVVATMRSDFFDRLERLPPLARLAGGEAKYLLTPPDDSEIGQIIRQPAREAGLHFEIDSSTGHSLDETIREAAAGDAASLPLLEYLLDQLWHRRTASGQLTYAAYQELGGLHGAIGRRAEEVLAGLAPEVQAALPRLLRALVSVQPGARTAATARYARIEHFRRDGDLRRLIEAMLAPQARLLVADDGAIRVAHEALLTHWPRAQDQIAEDRSDLQLRSRLEEGAVRWQSAPQADRKSLLLAQGLPLSEAEDLLRRRRAELEAGVVAYVDASVTAARQRQRRAARRLGAVAAVLALLALGAAVGAWQAIEGRRESERALRRAETNFEQALALVDTIMTDTVAKFQDLGMPKDQAKSLLARIDPVLALLEREQTNDALASRRWELLVRLSDLYKELGALDDALKQIRTATDLASRQVARAPADIAWQRRLALSQARTCEAQKTGGDLPGALAYCRNAADLTRALSARNPDSARLLADLANQSDRIGDILAVQGDLAGANGNYRQGFEIRSRLVAMEPGTMLWRQHLAISHDKIGNVLVDLGNFSEALQVFRDGLEIRRKLAEQEPGNTLWQRDVAISQHKIGDVLRTTGDLAGSLTAHREGVEIIRRLSERDPTNRSWQDDLSYGHRRVGDTLSAQGDTAAALEAYGKSLAIMQHLARLDPANVAWQDELQMIQSDIGDALLAQGDWTKALDAIRASQEIALSLVARDPTHVRWQGNLAGTHRSLGVALLGQGNASGALRHFRESLDIVQHLADRDPKRARWQRDMAISHGRIAAAAIKLGERTVAAQSLHAAAAIMRTLLAQQPDNPYLKIDADWIAGEQKLLGLE